VTKLDLVTKLAPATRENYPPLGPAPDYGRFPDNCGETAGRGVDDSSLFPGTPCATAEIWMRVSDRRVAYKVCDRIVYCA
jgi:hypothetical protein